jgi:hypothetical protein
MRGDAFSQLCAFAVLISKAHHHRTAPPHGDVDDDEPTTAGAGDEGGGGKENTEAAGEPPPPQRTNAVCEYGVLYGHKAVGPAKCLLTYSLAARRL